MKVRLRTTKPSSAVYEKRLLPNVSVLQGEQVARVKESEERTEIRKDLSQ